MALENVGCFLTAGKIGTWVWAWVWGWGCDWFYNFCKDWDWGSGLNA